ncbi:MAG: hypothetical protein JWN44_4799 [Myxococcales bacterium]|nr:hypothetical protein [Myxococcales bacterium]
MTRARSIIAVVVAALGWAAVTACNQQTIQTPLRSFDRPSDVALTCVQYDPVHGKYNARPFTDCDPITAKNLGITPDPPFPSSYIAPLGPNPPFTPFVMAAVTQSARGELALVDTAQNKKLDADPLKPGFGFLPVGKLPEHVRATRDGCWAVTTNSDSCDYGVVELSTMINHSLISLTDQDMGSVAVSDAAIGVRRLRATVDTGATFVDTDGAVKPVLRTLPSRPAWIEMAPESDGAPATHGYEAGGTPGLCVGGVHKAWVALPGCQLVVKLHFDADPSQASVEKALRVTQSGVTEVTDLKTLECPVECAGDAADMGGVLTPPPAAPTDLGAPAPTQALPGTLAIDVETDIGGAKEGGRLIIGDLHSERLDIVPFVSASGAIGTPRKIQLETGAQGVRIVRVAPRSEAGKFLYAIARDGSIRVIDLDREVECETNPDPRYVSASLNMQQTPTSNPPLPDDPTPQARRLGCFPLGDPSTPRRAPLATSPGITLASGQLPADVAFVHLDAPPGITSTGVAPPSAGPGLLVGDFAWIVTSDGKGLIANIFDACPPPNQQDEKNTVGPYTPVCSLSNVATANLETRVKYGHPEAMLLDRVSHRLRNSQQRFVSPATPADTVGQPRVPDPNNPCAVAIPTTSVSNVPDGGVVDGGIGGTCTASNLVPGLFAEPVPDALLPFDPEISHQDFSLTRVVRFIDPQHARNETWVASWEGVLPGSDRSLGFPFVSGGQGYLSDPGGTWCLRGARAGDKLVFRGCTVDSECNQATGFQCVRDPGAFTDQQQGMCLHVDAQHPAESWPASCGALLRSQRKYRIGSARQSVKLPAGAPGPDGTPMPNEGDPTDLLTLQEIYEPEYRVETADCASSDAVCDKVTVTTVGGTTRKADCLTDYDGAKRCIFGCKSDSECGQDFQCLESAQGGARCMRAPVNEALWATCMPQLQNYEIHVGEAFAILGSGSGHLVSESPGPGGECIETPQSSEYVRLRQARVPLTATKCASTQALDSMDQATGRNVCQIDLGDMQDRLIHFENPIFNIAIRLPTTGTTADGTLRPIVPADGTVISMQVTGGGQALLTLLGIDVEAQQPRAAVVGPDGQTVYIVDEGKSTFASGLRGQLLRLFSPSQAIDNQFIVR